MNKAQAPEDGYSEFCRQTLQAYAPSLYTISLLAAGGAQREALWAVSAFFHEVSKTRETVSEPTLGLIRLQWWRDELAKIYVGQTPEGQIMGALSKIVAQYDVPETLLQSIIDAYDDELRMEKPPQSVAEALAMIDAQNAPLIALYNHVSGQENSAETCSVVARNLGLVDVLRRAQPSSIIRQAQDAFVDAFDESPSPSGRALKTVQAYSLLQYHHMKKAGFDPYRPVFHTPVPFEMLRLWTGLLFS